MRRHLDLLNEASFGVLEINIWNAVTATGESRSAAMIHAKQGGLVTTLVHLLDQFEEIRFTAAKRIIVFVAILRMRMIDVRLGYTCEELFRKRTEIPLAIIGSGNTCRGRVLDSSQ